MTWHPSEDDLILHFYGERPDSPDPAHAAEGQGGVEGHLETCAPCRAAWMDLTDTMQLMDAAPLLEPGPAFERVMWARVAPQLPAPRAPWWSARRLLPLAAGLAAVAVVAIAGGRLWLGHHTLPAGAAPVAAVKKPTSTRDRVLLAALDDHFETAQTLLVELMNAPGGPAGPASEAADFSFARATAGELISDGRVYRTTARQNGDLQFAVVLDDLEALLVDVARTPDRMDGKDLESLRARITDASLLFKVRAVSNEIRDREKRSVLGE